MQKTGYVNSCKEPGDGLSCGTGPNPQAEPEFLCRNGVLAAAAAGAIFAGIALPLPSYILDVLLIFSISLTVAVLLIVFSARQITQIQGFPLLLVMITALRTALSVASGKMILSAGNAGTITGFFGSLIVCTDFVPSILIFGLVAVIIFAVICKIIRDITRFGTKYSNDILPYEQSIIKDELHSPDAHRGQARQRQRKLSFESCFFTAMTRAAQFMLFAAALELVIIIFNIVGGLAAGTSTYPNTENSTRTYIVLAVGSSMIAYVSYLFTALASRYLVRNLPGHSDTAREFDFSQNRRTINSSEVKSKARSQGSGISHQGKQSAPANDIDNHNFQSLLVQYRESAAHSEVSFPRASGSNPQKVREDVSAEFASLDYSANEKIKEGAGDNPDVHRGQSEGYYQSITKMILDENSIEKTGAATTLMAAENVSSLPVTLPVNIAVRLAQQGRKCLLIDLDFDRNAIAKVFDINQTSPAGEPATACQEDAGRAQGNLVVRSCIENIFIFPAANLDRAFASQHFKGIKDVISAMKQKFEFLIIYAPNIINAYADNSFHPSAGNPAQMNRSLMINSRNGHLSLPQQIAGTLDSAILFTPGTGGSDSYEAWKSPQPDKTYTAEGALNELRDLLKENSCRIIDSEEIFAGLV